jgi:CRP-like cAMP-binding protein
MSLAAASLRSLPHQSLPTAGAGRSVLLAESRSGLGGPPSLFELLSPQDREIVLKQGRLRVLNRGQTLFKQGARHDGIFLIQTGRIRVFYAAPSQREITLAYWHPGNFVGGPEVFGPGIHQWSGMAATNSSVLEFSGKTLRGLVVEVPNLAIGLIQALSFKGKCYSALAQMLGTRSVTERLAYLLLHLSEIYGVADPEGVLIDADFTHADLAHMVGATRQWVTMSLKRLQARGVVVSCRSRILVRRSDLLTEMLDSAPRTRAE